MSPLWVGRYAGRAGGGTVHKNSKPLWVSRCSSTAALRVDESIRRRGDKGGGAIAGSEYGLLRFCQRE
jgi:hypothetical protein